MARTDAVAPPVTARAAAKEERRRELLAAAGRLMAARGFHAVRLEDVGAAVGISGPAVYRHVASKEELLRVLLEDISQRLHDGAAAVVARALAPEETLSALVDNHVAFALSEPDLIRVQDRDLLTLSASSRREVRALQRRYVEMWVGVLQCVVPGLGEARARVRAHAAFGLVNSAPHLPAGTAEDDVRVELRRMALVALTLPA